MNLCFEDSSGCVFCLKVKQCYPFFLCSWLVKPQKNMVTMRICLCLVIITMYSNGTCSNASTAWTEACHCRSKTCTCVGATPENIILSVPRNTTSLVCYFHGVFRDGGLNFSSLSLLEHLVLTTHDLRQYEYGGILRRKETFDGLRNLKHLAIHVSLLTLNPDVLLGLSALTSLDLSFTRYLGIAHVSTILERLNDSGLKLRRLNLTNIQYPSPTEPTSIVNLNTQILSKVSKLPLLELDISWNGLILFTPGLVEKTPNLRYFRSRGNIHSNTGGSYQTCSLLDVMLHPSLQHVELGNDEFDYFEPTNQVVLDECTKTCQYNAMSSASKYGERNFSSSDKPPKGPTIPNKITTTFADWCCKILTCFIVNYLCKGYTVIPCENVPCLVAPPGENCQRDLYIPISKSLTSIWYKNAQRDMYGNILLISNNQTKPTCFLPSNNLKELDISENEFGHYLQLANISIKGTNKLETVNLAGNSLQFDGDTTLLKNKESLKVLIASRNKFSLHLAKSSQMFENTTSLEVLMLSSCEIQNIHRQALASLRKLKALDLSFNELSNFDVNITTMESVGNLNFSHNRIELLPDHVTSHLTRVASFTNLTIDLTSNPLQCQCKTLKFVEWLKHSSGNIADFNLLLCTHPTGGRVSLKDLSLEELHSYCFPSNVTLITATVLATSGFFLVILLIIFAYRRRWTIRYWLHAAHQTWEKKRIITTDGEHHFRFDAFVVYSTEDRLWVHDNLLSTLEGEHGKKLCVHCRNFIPGRYIEDAIWESITSSYKSILILSLKFLESRWCDEEFRMARQASMEEKRDVIILVLLKPLPVSGLSRHLRKMLQERNYVEWTDDVDGQKLFWDRLLMALN